MARALPEEDDAEDRRVDRVDRIDTGLSRALCLLAVLVSLVVAGSASAAMIRFEAVLDPRQELHGPNSFALGVAQVQYDTQTHLLLLEATVLGLSYPGAIQDYITGWHMHVAPEGVNGARIIDFVAEAWGETQIIPGMQMLGAGFTVLIDLDDPGMLNEGMFPGTCDTTPDCLDFFEAQLLMSNIYLNLHTFDEPLGEVRGQLTQVPEAGTSVLIAAGLIGLAFAGRERSTS